MDIIEAREERKAKLREAEAAQYRVDLEALDALEIEHGDARVSHVRVGYAPDYPVLAIFRAASETELKRYRARVVRAADAEKSAVVQEATAEVAGCTWLYPPQGAVRDAMVKALPGLPVQIGSESLKLVTGIAASEGKG